MDLYEFELFLARRSNRLGHFSGDFLKELPSEATD
jgi:hypothetical protein